MSAGLVIELRNFDAFERQVRVLDQILDDIDRKVGRVGSAFDALDNFFATAQRRLVSLNRTLQVLDSRLDAINPKLDRFSNLIREIDGISVAGIERFSDALGKISDDVDSLEAADRALASLASAFDRLDGANIREFSDAVDNLNPRLRTFVNTVREIDGFNPADINALASALGRVAAETANLRGAVTVLDDFAGAFARLLALDFGALFAAIDNFFETLRQALARGGDTAGRIRGLALAFNSLLNALRPLVRLTPEFRTAFGELTAGLTILATASRPTEQVARALQSLENVLTALSGRRTTTGLFGGRTDLSPILDTIRIVRDALTEFEGLRRVERIRAATTAINAVRTIITQFADLEILAARAGGGESERLRQLLRSITTIAPVLRDVGRTFQGVRRISNIRAVSTAIRGIAEILEVINEFLSGPNAVGIPPARRTLFLRTVGGLADLLPNIRGLARSLTRAIREFEGLTNVGNVRVAGEALRNIGQFIAEFDDASDFLLRQDTRRFLLIGPRLTRVSGSVRALVPIFRELAQALSAFSDVRINPNADFASIGKFFESVARVLPQIERVGGTEIFRRSGFLFRRQSELQEVGRGLGQFVRTFARLTGRLDPSTIQRLDRLASVLTRLSTVIQRFSRIESPEISPAFAASVASIIESIRGGFEAGDLREAGNEAGRGLGRSFLRGLRRVLRISSPSRAMTLIAQQVGDGFRAGLELFNAGLAGARFARDFVNGVSRTFNTLFRTFTTEVLNQFRRFASDFTRLQRDITRDVFQTGQQLVQTGLQGLATGGVAGFISGQAVNIAATFEQLSRQIEVFGGESLDAIGGIESVQEAILDFSAATIFSANEASEAFLGLLKSGLDAAEAVATLPEVGNLAAAANLDIATSTDLAVRAANAFGIEFENITRITDAFVGAADISTASVATLGQAFGFVGNDASALGVTLEDTAAALALLNDSGITAERAGTGLRQVFASLSSPTERAQQSLEELGVSVFDTSGEFVGFTELLRQFSEGLAGRTTQEINALLNELGDVNAVSAIKALADVTEDGTLAFEQYTEALGGANTAADVANSLIDTFRGSVISLRGSVETLIITALGPLLEDSLKPIVDQLIIIVNNLADLPQPILTAASAAVFLGTAFITLGSLIALLTGLFAFSLTPALAVFSFGLSALVQIFVNPLGVLFALSAFSSLLVGAIAVTAAFGGAIAAAITVVQSFRDAIRRNVDGAGDEFSRLRDAIAGIFTELSGIANNIGSLFEAIFSRPDGTDEAVAGFVDINEGAEQARGAIASLLSGFASLAEGIRSFLSDANTFLTFFSQVQDFNDGGFETAAANLDRVAELEARRAQLELDIATRPQSDFAFRAFDAEDTSGLLAAVVQGERQAEGFLEAFITRIEEERGESPFSEFLRANTDEIIAAAEGDAEAIQSIFELEFDGQTLASEFDVGAFFDAEEGLSSVRDVLLDIERIDPGSTRELIDEVLANPGRFTDDFVEAMRELNGEFDEFTAELDGAVRAADEYEVAAGDTLTAIANRFGVGIEEILAANPAITDPNRIFVGQEIVIPGVTIDDDAQAEAAAELQEVEEELQDELILAVKLDQQASTQALTRFQQLANQVVGTDLFQRFFGELPEDDLDAAIEAIGTAERNLQRFGSDIRGIGTAFSQIFSGQRAEGIELLGVSIGQATSRVIDLFEVLSGVDVISQIEENLDAGRIGAAISAALRGIAQAISRFLVGNREEIATGVESVLRFLQEDITLGLIDLIGEVFGVQNASSFLRPIADFFATVVGDGVRLGIRLIEGDTTIRQVLSDALTALFTSIPAPATLIRNIILWFVGILRAAFSGEGTAGELFEPVRNLFESIFDSIADNPSAVISSISGFLLAALSGVGINALIARSNLATRFANAIGNAFARIPIAGALSRLPFFNIGVLGAGALLAAEELDIPFLREIPEIIDTFVASLVSLVSALDTTNLTQSLNELFAAFSSFGGEGENAEIANRVEQASDIFRQFGNAIAFVAAQGIASGLQIFIDGLAASISFLAQAVASSAPTINAGLDFVGQIIDRVSASISRLQQEGTLNQFAAGLTAVALVIQRVFVARAGLAVRAVALLASNFALAVGAFIAFGAIVNRSVEPAVDTLVALGNVISGIITAFQTGDFGVVADSVRELAFAFDSLAGAILAGLIDAVVFIADTGINIAQAFGLEGLDEAFRQRLFDALRAAADAVASAGLFATLADIGRGVVDGLISGIESGIAPIVSALTGIIDTVINTVRSLLGIASPSTVFFQIGLSIVEGLVLGLQIGVQLLQSAFDSLFNLVLRFFDDDIAEGVQGLFEDIGIGDEIQFTGPIVDALDTLVDAYEELFVALENLAQNELFGTIFDAIATLPSIFERLLAPVREFLSDLNNLVDVLEIAVNLINDFADVDIDIEEIREIFRSEEGFAVFLLSVGTALTNLLTRAVELYVLLNAEIVRFIASAIRSLDDLLTRINDFITLPQTITVINAAIDVLVGAVTLYFDILGEIFIFISRAIFAVGENIFSVVESIALALTSIAALYQALRQDDLTGVADAIVGIFEGVDGVIGGLAALFFDLVAAATRFSVAVINAFLNVLGLGQISEDAVDTVVSVFEGLADRLREGGFFGEIIRVFIEAFNFIVEAAQVIASGIVSLIVEAFAGLGAIAGTAARAFRDFIVAVINNVVSVPEFILSALVSVVTQTFEAARTLASAVFDGTVAAITRFVDAILAIPSVFATLVQSVINGVLTTARTVANIVATVFNGAVALIANTLDNLPSIIATLVLRAFGTLPALIPLAALAFIQFLTAVFNFVSAVPQALLGFGSFILRTIAAAIEGAAETIPQFIDSIVEAFEELTDIGGDTLAEFFSDLAAGLDIFSRVFEDLTGLDISAFTDIFREILSTLEQFFAGGLSFAEAAQQIGDSVTALLDEVIAVAVNAFENPTQAIEDIRQAFVGVFGAALNIADETLDSLGIDITPVRTFISGVLSRIREIAAAVFNGDIEGAAEGALGLGGEIQQLIVGALGNALNFADTTLDSLGIDITPLRNFIGTVVTQISELFTSIISGDIEGTVEDSFALADTIGTAIADSLNAAIDFNEATFEALGIDITPLTGFASRVVDQILQIFNSAINGDVEGAAQGALGLSATIREVITDAIEAALDLTGIELPALEAIPGVSEVTALVDDIADLFAFDIDLDGDSAATAVGEFFAAITDGSDDVTASIDSIITGVELLFLNLQLTVLGIISLVVGELETIINGVLGQLNSALGTLGLGGVGEVNIETGVNQLVADIEAQIAEIEGDQVGSVGIPVRFELPEGAAQDAFVDIRSQILAASASGELSDAQTEAALGQAFGQFINRSIAQNGGVGGIDVLELLNLSEQGIDLSVLAETLTVEGQEQLASAINSRISTAFERGDVEQALDLAQIQIDLGETVEFDLPPEQVVALNAELITRLNEALAENDAQAAGAAIELKAAIGLSQDEDFTLPESDIAVIEDAIAAGFTFGEDSPIAQAAANAGSSVIAGLVAGFSDEDGEITTAAGQLFADFDSALTGPEAFNIESPSLWAVAVGKNVLSGLALGLAEGRDPIMEQINSLFATFEEFEQRVIRASNRSAAAFQQGVNAIIAASLPVGSRINQLIGFFNNLADAAGDLSVALGSVGSALGSAVAASGQAAASSGGTQPPPGRQTGGTVQAGGIFRINERSNGRPLTEVFTGETGNQFIIPGENGTISPLRSPNAAMIGGDTNIQYNITVNVENGGEPGAVRDEVVAALEQNRRDNQFRERAQRRGVL